MSLAAPHYPYPALQRFAELLRRAGYMLYSFNLHSSLPFLRSQPALGNFIITGQEIISIGAGNELSIGQLHPPAGSLLTLEEGGFHIRESHMKFEESFPIVQQRFPFVHGFPIQEIPDHLCY